MISVACSIPDTLPSVHLSQFDSLVYSVNGLSDINKKNENKLTNSVIVQNILSDHSYSVKSLFWVGRTTLV